MQNMHELNVKGLVPLRKDLKKSNIKLQTDVLVNNVINIYH